MEDAIQNYMSLKYTNGGDGDAIEDGGDTSMREMAPADQIIIVQQKGTLKKSMNLVRKWLDFL